MKRGILTKVILSALLVGQMNLFNTQAVFASENTTNDIIIESTKARSTTIGYVKTSGINLNVRQSASTNSNILGSLKNGSQITIVETLSGWYKIKYGTGYAYISSSYVSFSEGESIATSVGYVKTNGIALNVRQSTSTTSNILGKLSNGTKVEIVGTLSGWYKIKYGTSYGYVSSSYISNTPVSNSVITTQTAYVKTGSINLNVRQSASTSSTILGKLSNKTQITIVETLNGWYKIKYGTGYGYVSSSYVTFTAPTSSLPDINTSKVGYVLANFTHSAYYNNGSSWGQCVWYVKGRAKEKLGHSVWSIMGNANQWYRLAVSKGAPTSSNVNDVRSNSILCRAGGSQGYGHVVYIEYVDTSSPQKWVYYTESNVGGTNGALKKLSFSDFKTKVATSNFQGYIYLQ